MKLTAIYMKVPEGYITFIEEARANLREAVELVLEANRSMAEESMMGEPVIREAFELPVA